MPTKSFKPLAYGNALDQLRVAYRRGLLVPFVGSGLSAPRLRLWSGLVRALAQAAGIKDLQLGQHPTDQELIVASERVVWSLRAQGRSLSRAVKDALPNPDVRKGNLPDAARALASAWWPLVLTTNYDDLFLKAFNKRHHRAKHDGDAMAVVGRSARDCHTVLAALDAPVRPLLWALQGFLGKNLNGISLRREIVLGYDQYRQATFDNAGFRAAFSEVYRNRSLLFAGVGLGEDYFRGLFGESLVRLGANQHAHCVLINSRDLGPDTPWFLHTRLNIVVLTYDDPAKGAPYSGFEPCLKAIAHAVAEPPRGSRRFWVRRAAPATSVDIEPSPLPSSLAPGHWVVCSAGQKRDGTLRIGRDVPAALRQPSAPVQGHADLRRGRNQRVLLAIARDAHSETGRLSRDLRTVAEATQHALEVAVENGARKVSFMLLSASVHAGRWPRVFSLVQMLRGIRRFVEERTASRSGHDHALQIVIHDTAAARPRGKEPERSVWHAVETGKLDPVEVLNCSALRFFVEVELDGSSSRIPLYLDEGMTIQQVAQYLQLKSGWSAALEPAPRGHNEFADVKAHLRDAGVVPGSTLRFTRNK